MKFNKKLKKGFTLVELIVVIAIVAILAAVSVVSYLAFINSANESADVQLVKQLNICLQSDEALHGKKDWSGDYSGLTELLESNGFIVENLTKTKSGCDMVYQGTDRHGNIINRYALLKGDDVLYSETTFDKDSNYRNLWIPETAKEAQDLSEEGKGVVLGDELGEISEDFIAHGSVIVNNANVTSIKYLNSDENKEVIISTNGGTLTVGLDEDNVAKGQIWHYGALDKAIIYTENSCFHTHAKINQMDLHKGKAIAEDKAYVTLVKADANTLVEEKDTGVFYIPSSATTENIDADVAATLGYNVTAGGTTADEERTKKLDSTVYEVDNKYDLIALSEAVNAGNNFANRTVKLNRDIDLDGVDWTPIGQYKDLDGNDVKVKFSGTFDGQNHTIDNMHINALSSLNTYKSSYRALFGYTNGIIENFTIKGSIVGSDCAGVVAALDAGGQILNVNSYVILTGQIGKKGGSIEEYQDYLQGKTGGICITVKGSGIWKIESCNNYGNVTSGKDGAGGIIGWTNELNSNFTTTGLFIRNCNNYGAITSTGTSVPAGGISGNAGGKFYIENCTNEGAINGATAGGIFGNCGAGAIAIDCENKGTISGTQIGGIGGYVYNVIFSNLKNSGTINGSGAKGEIFGQADCTNVDANEFTFNRNIPAIGVYNPKADNVKCYIDHADNDTVGVIDYTINANKTDTVQIRNSTITTLEVKPRDNHTSKLELDNSNIETVNLNKNVSGMNFGFSMYIYEKEGTTNSLGNVNLYGTLKSGYTGDQIHLYFGIACTFNRTSEASSAYILFMNAMDGYSISGPVSNAWTVSKNA